MLRHLRVVTARVSASGILSGERAEWATKWPSTVLTCFRVRSVPHGRLAVWACASAQGTALARPQQKKKVCFRSHFGSSLALLCLPRFVPWLAARCGSSSTAMGCDAPPFHQKNKAWAAHTWRKTDVGSAGFATRCIMGATKVPMGTLETPSGTTRLSGTSINETKNTSSGSKVNKPGGSCLRKCNRLGVLSSSWLSLRRAPCCSTHRRLGPRHQQDLLTRSTQQRHQRQPPQRQRQQHQR